MIDAADRGGGGERMPGGADDPLARLQAWYAAQTDGDWEHSYGIRISTLDNPGWMLKVNLEGTALEGRPFGRVREDRSETDWVDCVVEADVFRGAGGTHNLRELIEVFVRWADGAP